MKKCWRCGVRFDEPIIVEYRENLDGENGWATFQRQFCPICGNEDFEEEQEDAKETDV